MNLQKTIRLKREKSTPTNRAGNNGPTGVNNFAQQGGGFPGGGFPGGGFPGGGQRGGGGGDFGGGQRGGGNFPGGNRRNNGGFNQQTTGPTVTFRIQAQNLLNSVQYNNFVGTMTSSFFGFTNSARNSRQIETSVRFNF